MNRQEYAGQNGEHNPVLEESWRRTWWSLYITDCLFAGIRGESKFALRTIASTVDLPCEECLYNNGVCKTPPLGTAETYQDISRPFQGHSHRENLRIESLNLR
jgi:hypothetical protein